MRDHLVLEVEEALQIEIFSNPANEDLPPKACAEQFYSSHPELMEKLNVHGSSRGSPK